MPITSRGIYNASGLPLTLLERAADVFDGGAAAGEKESVPDLKELHAKIGQQALEIDFLSGALTNAGLLSARK